MSRYIDFVDEKGDSGTVYSVRACLEIQSLCVQNENVDNVPLHLTGELFD